MLLANSNPDPNSVAVVAVSDQNGPQIQPILAKKASLKGKKKIEEEKKDPKEEEKKNDGNP